MLRAPEEPLVAAEHAPPMILLQMLAGAVTQSVYAEVLHGRAGEIEQLLPLLTYLLIVPCTGRPRRRDARASAGAGLTRP